MLLVIDDDTRRMATHCDALHDAGYSVVAAGGPEEAAALWRHSAQPPLLVIVSHLGEATARALGDSADPPAAVVLCPHGDSYDLSRHLRVLWQLTLPVEPAAVVRAVRASRAQLARAISPTDGPTLLARASRTLAEAINAPAPAQEALQLLIPHLARWCVLDCTAESGGANALTVVAVEPQLREALRRVAMRGRGISPTVAVVLQTGVTQVRGALSEKERRTWDEHAGEPLWNGASVGQLMTVPLRTRGRVVGTLSLGCDEPLDESLVETIEDLAARIALALDNHMLVRQLREAVRAREDLLAMVSHDLRSPLGAIMMAAGYLNKRGRPARRGPSEAHSILRNARRMERLLRDLLDYSQLEAGTLRVQLRPHRLGQVVTRELDDWRGRAAPRLVSLTVQPEAESVLVLCDIDRLKQVLDNLITNAIKATAPQGRIHVEVDCTLETATIAVSDTGAGIPQTELEKVFERYRGGRRAGAGLGLYITRGLVEAHGGEITVSSMPGRGSCFTASFPRIDTSLGESEVGPIFLVDDDEVFRRELEEVLQDAGYRVASADSGTRALDYLAHHERPSLILLDLMMPVMNGWELNAALRESPQLSEIPRVVFSCLDRERSAAALAGVKAYLEKPLRMNQLMNVVRRFAGPGAERGSDPWSIS